MLPFPQLRQSALIWVEQKATVVGGQLQVVGMHYALCTMHYAEAQKPKNFRVATFYAQKLSGRSARNRFSQQA